LGAIKEIRYSHDGIFQMVVDADFTSIIIGTLGYSFKPLKILLRHQLYFDTYKAIWESCDYTGDGCKVGIIGVNQENWIK
jgi:hypothetical protein